MFFYIWVTIEKDEYLTGILENLNTKFLGENIDKSNNLKRKCI